MQLFFYGKPTVLKPGDSFILSYRAKTSKISLFHILRSEHYLDLNDDGIYCLLRVPGTTQEECQVIFNLIGICCGLECVKVSSDRFVFEKP